MRNTLRNALRPGWTRVMAGKVATRVLERDETRAAVAWAERRAVSTEELMDDIEPGMRAEAEAFGDELHRFAEDRMQNLGVSLGGGGNYVLLYFLVRHLRPDVAVETGVAAGYSSQAMLRAMARNGQGQLYSSDFPYFRLQDPERYIGVLVDDELRDRWTLLTAGDRRNLPQILSACGPVGIFHYDSDKSNRGRAWAMRTMRPHLAADAVVVMDDIGDNLFFSRLVTQTPGPYRVVRVAQKYVGVTGL